MQIIHGAKESIYKGTKQRGYEQSAQETEDLKNVNITDITAPFSSGCLRQECFIFSSAFENNEK